MIRAILRWFKVVGLVLTGRIDEARRLRQMNPYAVRATYDEVVQEKNTRIQQYKQALAGLVAQQEKKMDRLKELTNDVQRLEDLKTGAAAKAKQRVTRLQTTGTTAEEVQRDEDYLKCRTAFNDFSSTLAEKQKFIGELEGDIQGLDERIKNHKIQLQQLLRELDKIKVEAEEAVADIITAREEREIADMLAGIAEDGTAKELQEMRDLRQRVKAEARVSKELAGVDTRVQEAQFLEFASKSAADEEFDALVGLAKKVEEPAPAQVQKEKLPE